MHSFNQKCNIQLSLLKGFSKKRSWLPSVEGNMKPNIFMMIEVEYERKIVFTQTKFPLNPKNSNPVLPSIFFLCADSSDVPFLIMHGCKS